MKKAKALKGCKFLKRHLEVRGADLKAAFADDSISCITCAEKGKITLLEDMLDYEA